MYEFNNDFEIEMESYKKQGFIRRLINKIFGI